MMHIFAVPILLLALVTQGAMAQTATTPEARWNAVAACATRADDRTRHACVDQVLHQAGLLEAEAVARPETAPPEMPERFEAQVAVVGKGSDGRITITTTDGAVWRQTETVELRFDPVVGQTIEIRKAALGSSLCVLPRNPAYRCRRTR